MAGCVFERVIKRRMQGDPEFAARAFFRLAARAERQRGPDAKQTLNLRQDYAVALRQSGQYEKAEAELSVIIARRELTADTADHGLRHAKLWHSRVLLDLGRFDEAEPELRRLSEECDRILGTDHPDSVDIHANHAVVLAELNRFGEAEEEMAVVVAKRTAAEGPDDAATLHDRTQLAVILDALDRHEASKVLWRELAESKARVLGTGHPDAILARSRLALV
jgi:tetratricopeptide (TPR) repeat protein